MRQDVEWTGKIHQGVQGQAGGVFQAVFMSNTLRQVGILPGIDGQLFQGRQQITVAVAKRRNACRILGIQHCPVGQHQPHSGQRMVAVLGRTTAHTAGIVRNNAANLTGVDGRRIRSDLEALGCQPGIRLSANHTRLQTNLAAFFPDVVAVPLIAQNNQDRITDRLSGKAGTGGPEGHRDLVAAGDGQEIDNLCFILNPHHHLWDQAVETGVGSERKGGHRIVKDPVFGNPLPDIGQHFRGKSHASSRTSTMSSRGPWAP